MKEFQSGFIFGENNPLNSWRLYLIFTLSPHHTSEDFEDGWTLDDKIEVFIARIEGWQLGVAEEIVNKKINGRGLALLHILFSFLK